MNAVVLEVDLAWLNSVSKAWMGEISKGHFCDRIRVVGRCAVCPSRPAIRLWPAFDFSAMNLGLLIAPW